MFLLIFIFALLVIPFLLYAIPKKIGFKKTGIILVIIYFVAIIGFISSVIFEDELFFKKDARKLLKEQNIELVDKFSLDNNDISWDFSSYFQTFILTISDNDKQKIIEQIKKSDNFKSLGMPIENIIGDTILGIKTFQNYETEFFFIREFYEYQGKGMLYIYRKIKIDKKTNKLIFEEKDD